MTVSNFLGNCRIAFTSPASYAEFLKQHLEAAGAKAVWVPTIEIQRSDRTRAHIRETLTTHLSQVSGIAFTSRNGIDALAAELPQILTTETQLKNPFLLGALGRDVEGLSSLTALWAHPHSQILCPDIATPQALVELLGHGQGRSILCPVPRVVGLREPDVVPNFLAALEQSNWCAIRVDAYETAWNGPNCAQPLWLPNQPPEAMECVDGSPKTPQLLDIQALVFTSTAEVEGLLASFEALGVDPFAVLDPVLIAAHGPVTARGARALGLEVQVVSRDSSSFAGVVQALQDYWRTTPS